MSFPAGARVNADAEGAAACLRTSNVQQSLEYDDLTFIPAEYVKRDDQWLRPDDVVMSIANSAALVGKVARAEEPLPQRLTFGAFLSVLRPRIVDPAYLFQFLSAPSTQSQLRNAASQTTNIANLSVGRIEGLEVPVPPLNEQRRIVAKLESLQVRSRHAREALDAVPPLLEKLRRSILAAAFRGDLTKDWRAKHKDVEPASELLKRIRAERRKKWEETELAKMKAKGKAPSDDRWKAAYKEPAPSDTTNLAQLPDGWIWTTFETVAEVDLGRQRAPQYQTGRHTRPYLRVANIKDDRIDTTDVLEMDFDAEDFAHYQLRPGDILLSEGQSPELVGQSAIYDGGIEGLCFQKTLHRFRAYRSGPSPQYAQLLFRHYLRSGVFRSVASLTVNIAHLTLVRLKPLHFPLPPQAEAAELVRRAGLALDRVRELESMHGCIHSDHQALQRAILAKAFRGELVPQDPTDEPADVMLARLADSAEPVASTQRVRSRSPKRKAG